jgi:hypothetical protein
MRLGVPVASPITAFAVCCWLAEGLLQPLARNRFRLIDPCDSQRP